ncbi:DNRLRE domain-containing protein [Streptomyces sp. IMTB 1903]|uniref:DNRLRE domain-containing protein n=1 Tax=Streptomyces sp. IMTB 1903 TaxID=1776680 RepID=UPI00075B73C0|nr:DNRLRE domain-containing protein [Streptomyces sp. IMTB 1903]
MAVSDTAAESASVADDPPRRRWFRRRRTVGGLAALLAVAVAVPVGVQIGGDEKPKVSTSDGATGPVTAPQARNLAAETGKDVEVSAERSANTTTWAQPDGVFKKHISSSAVRARVGEEWKAIDTDLHQVEGGFAAKAVNGAVVFSGGSAGGGRAARGSMRPAVKTDTPGPVWTELVRLGVDGHEMTVAWPGELPAPVIDGPRALYENVRPGVDLLMTAQDAGYSHLLVVKDKQAAADPLLAEINYRLASPDLQFRLDAESGSLSARDAAGEEVAGSPSPLMWDSSGKVATTDDVPAWKPSALAARHPTLGLAGLAGAERARLAVAAASYAEGTLTLKPDAALLNAPDTVYPVFLDPSFKGHKRSWSLLYKTAGNSSFYNGQNYNASGTNEARVGYESDSGGTSRSIFNFDFGSELHGAGIRTAVVRALQTYSWSCTRKDMDIYSTPYASSSSTWNSTTGWWGNKIGTEGAGYGYNSSCPDNWVAPDIKGLVSQAASARWNALSLGFKAPSESDSYYWKKLLANGESAPYIEVTYNSPPDIPVAANMSTSPGGACLTSGTGTSIGLTDVSFTVKGSDRDGNLNRLQIEIWDAGTGQPVFDKWEDANSEGVLTYTVPSSTFTNGRTYKWLSRAVDHDGFGSPGAGPRESGSPDWCTFTIDHTAPANPAVSSLHFPKADSDASQWSVNPASTPDQVVEFRGNGTAAGTIREYQWSLNKPTWEGKAPPTSGDLASVKLRVDTAGPNVLYVRTVNHAGNVSVPTEYLFYVSPRIGTDKPGDVTGDHFADLLAIDKDGNLRTYAGDSKGDTDVFIPGAVRDGKPVEPGHFKDPASAIPALIGHATDWHPGDGITDMIARMPDGKLYIYPGIGTGQFDAGRRIEMQLPLSAPDPATFRQIVVTEDIDGDGLPDLFALDADGFWAFSGYTGSSFASYRKMATGWAARDIVGVRDVSGDNVPDLLFRDNANANRTMALRKGKPGVNGGADLASLQFASSAEGGVDNTYATTAWNRTDWPKVLGTEDNTGDGIPDIWGVHSGGYQYYFQGGTTTHGEATGRDEDSWNTFLTIG